MKVSHSSSPAPSRSGRGPLLGNHLQLSHAVNSSEALRAFLCSGRLAAEADVTLDPRGRPILAHPPLTESDLSLAEFVGQLHRAGRGMKLDFKRKDAIAPALEVVGRVGVPSSSLIFNADVVALSGEPAPDFSIEDLLPVREAHPTAVLSLGAKMRFWNGDPGDLYTSSALDGFKAAADRLGGPVTFALRVDKVLRQPEVVEALSDVAKRRNITLWNDRSVLPYTKLDLDVLRRIVRNGFFDFDETVV